MGGRKEESEKLSEKKRKKGFDRAARGMEAPADCDRKMKICPKGEAGEVISMVEGPELLPTLKKKTSLSVRGKEIGPRGRHLLSRLS